MSAKIFEFNGITRLDLDPDRVLQKAVGQVTAVVVLGYDQDGELYIAASHADGGNLLWLIEQCKHRLMIIAAEGVQS
jgi:hypothetical protein